jgi:hypothetical protein
VFGPGSDGRVGLLGGRCRGDILGPVAGSGGGLKIGSKWGEQLQAQAQAQLQDAISAARHGQRGEVESAGIRAEGCRSVSGRRW